MKRKTRQVISPILTTHPAVTVKKRYFFQTPSRSPITMANSTAGELNDTCKLYQRSTQTWPARIIAFHAGLNIFLSIVASLGNVLIVVALHKVTIHPPTKLLFRCLAVTDLCVGFIVQPLHVMIIMYDITRINCTISVFAFELKETFFFGFCRLSIAVSTAISVDRLHALMLGLRYRQVLTFRRVRAVVIFFLSGNVSVSLIRFFWSRRIACIVNVVSITLFLVTSVVSYTKIFLRMRQHHVHVKDLVHYQTQPNGGGIPLNIARYNKTVSSIAWVQLVLVACHTPLSIVVMLWVQSRMVWLSTGTLVLLNSSLNPFLYCWKIKEVKKEV